MIIRTISVICLLICSSSSLAFQQRTAYINHSGVMASVGVVNLNKQVAADNFVEDSATYWKLGWEQQKNSWLLGLGISGYLYNDQAEFTQLTESLIGDTKEETSKANAFNVYVESGYNFRVDKRLNLAFLVGYEHAIKSDRSIDSCDDCYAQDIEINAGVYAHPRATYAWSRNWYSSLGYNAYFDDDIKNSLYLTVGTHF
ncbi:outer membrane beta-barrel protein [Thalassotalea sp. PLHSN55]|uniref:outer membrane beta-barrel protein n=1 Tax=Thalassotalea sp. PLHSN55 TaxID=3435888 RepID=UPI003F8788C3